ncbi:MAG: SGNH/GDSL hydrolase family protein, partial [Candidatus Hodarchaeales archaeon]
ERDVISYSPNLVIVTIGGNDANTGIPVEKYKENMELIVEKIQKNGAIPVLQTYYCPLYEKMSEPFQRFPKFVEVNRTLASEKDIPLIDQYKYFSAYYENDRENYYKLMLDGLHVNPIGNTIMGIIACRSFNVPDPKLMLDPKIIKDKKEISRNLRMMKNFCELPSRSRKS